MKYNFLKTITVVFSFVALVSCDKDYISLGGDVIGGENFNPQPGESFDFKVYNQKIGTIQTNNLALNQIGYLKNEVFGNTQSNFVTQLTLANLNPTFGNNVVIDSVVLSVPYLSKKSTGSDGKVKYDLLNNYGSGEIDLAVFRNNYELIDFDPNNDLATGSKYYSDQDPTFNSFKSGLSSYDPKIGDERLNDMILKDAQGNDVFTENTKFKPSDKEIIQYRTKSTKNTSNPSFYVMEYEIDKTQVETKLAPAMRLHLNKSYFNNAIMQANSSDLKSNAAFKKYFRGLYFQAKNVVSAEGKAMLLDFKKGSVIIYYKEDKIITEIQGQDPKTHTGGVVVPIGNERPMKTLSLTMTGNTVNLYNNFTNATSGNYENAFELPNQDQANFTAQNLYLKGGVGSMAFVELFTNSAKLDELKAKKPFINEASLVFTVDMNKMTSTVPLPKRIYLYDCEKDIPLVDYTFDATTNPEDAQKNKYIFSGILEEIKENDVVVKKIYKFRITELVNRILKGTQDNVRLGLVVTNDISDVTVNSLKSNITVPKFNTGGTNVIKRVQSSSTYSPLGTVLYGSTGDNAVKFMINYTTKN